MARGRTLKKAVVLARGLGTRMRAPAKVEGVTTEQHEVADAGIKALIPVGRPLLDYIVSALADVGLTDVCLVVPPEHDAFRERYSPSRLTRLTVSFAGQAEPKGTADAVLAAEAWVGDEPFLVINGDNYYTPAALRALAAAVPPSVAAYDRDALVRESNIPEERIARFALLHGAAGRLTQIVEKPDAAFMAEHGDAAVSMNLWAFTPSIFVACRAISPSARGEYELASAVQYAIDQQGARFAMIPVADGVLDLSSRADIPAVTQRLASVEVRL